MSWFRDEKSVAHRAQKVVSDMLVQLEKKNAKIEALEGVVLGLQEACVGPIEAELCRLEKRRDNLQQELDDTNIMIEKQRKILMETRHNIKNNLMHSEDLIKSRASSAADNVESITQNHSSCPPKTKNYEMSSNTEEFGVEFENNEDFYDEECEMVEIIRQLEPQLLFVLHRSNTDDMILYVPPDHRMNLTRSENDSLFLYRLQVFNDVDSAEMVSSLEMKMGFGPQRLDNSQRKDPSVMQLSYKNANSLPSYCEMSFDYDNSELVGDFVYAVKLPVLSNIVIDIWKIPAERQHGAAIISRQAEDVRQLAPKFHDFYFATTTIQGVDFVTLQRIFLIVETRWGLPTIEGVELSGRVSDKGKLLVEVISPS